MQPRFKVAREGLHRFHAAAVDSDFLEIIERVEQHDVPEGCAAASEVAEDFVFLLREVLGSDGGQRAGAHRCDGGRVNYRVGRAGLRVEEVQHRHLGGQAALVVVDVVSDDFDSGDMLRRDVAAKHVEMSVIGRVRVDMDARLY